MIYKTIEEAQMGLQEMCMDVEADQGADAVEAGYRDIVHACCTYCTDDVAAELLRREGFDPQLYLNRQQVNHLS